jgi:chromatin segregation and condensation protein Rec8/ScpA/Scc1 (kleisin family)
VREGQVEVHQPSAFGPIYLRKRAEGAAPPPADTGG